MNKRKCILGVLKTEAGLKIKEEMLSWLSPIYDVITVEVDPPNDIEFELPFIKKACEVSIESNEPVLYLHTKGAAMQNNAQPMVREFWRREFTGERSSLYFQNVACSQPCCSAPLVATTGCICWFNGFTLNPAAAQCILPHLTIHSDRYFFEQKLLKESGVSVNGPFVYETPTFTFQALIAYLSNKPFPKEPQLYNTANRVACVTLIKNEGPYIEEWLKYHVDLGIDKFFIINNNDEPTQDSELFKTLTHKYPVQIYNLCGQDALTIAGKQPGVLNHFYFNVIKPSNEFDWVTFIDVDEFIYLGGRKLKEFLGNPMFADTDIIHLNWRCYTDNGKIYKESGNVRDRFTEQAPLHCVYNGNEAAKGITENMFVKSIFRVTDKQTVISNTHTVFIQNGTCRRVNSSLSDSRYAADMLFATDCYIEHYITKSLEEYIDRRCVNATDVAHANIIDAKTRLEWYFNLNEKTPEKVAYVKERLGIEV